MIYILYLHIFCAFLSLALTLTRGTMLFSGKNWRAVKLLKILPHLSDTLLLLSGSVIFTYYPFSVESWLVAKLVLLVLYIILAANTFSRKVTQPKFIIWLLACLSLVAAIAIAHWH